HYLALPAIVQRLMDRFAEVTGSSYRIFEYHGHPEAEHVVVSMCSSVETIRETVDWMNARGARLGVVAVRLFQPFDVNAFIAALPKTTNRIAVLDRTKEPGCIGEPLYLNVVSAIAEGGAVFERAPRVVGGRYGLGSKEFTPAMVRAVYENLAAGEPLNHFTVGIADDVTHMSLRYDPDFTLEMPGVRQCVFVGLGADGTVGANKNSIKIIGEQTPNYAQGYFVY